MRRGGCRTEEAITQLRGKLGGQEADVEDRHSRVVYTQSNRINNVLRQLPDVGGLQSLVVMWMSLMKLSDKAFEI
jgi:hypothetical protein